jgi:hypothetical protein
MLMAAVTKTLLKHVLNAKDLRRLVSPAKFAFHQSNGQNGTTLGANLLIAPQTVELLFPTSVRVKTATAFVASRLRWWSRIWRLR